MSDQKEKQYKQIGDLFFHTATPDAVCQALITAHNTRSKVRIFYGSEGRIWLEESDMVGRIGRSTGSIKVPLMIAGRSCGGPAILDHCIVRIQDARTGTVLYMADGYKLPEFEIVVDAQPGNPYRWQVFEKLGKGSATHCASFKVDGQAERYIAFLRGERSTQRILKTDSQAKFKVTILFGEMAVANSDDDMPLSKLEKMAERHGGSLDTFGFETEAEVEAFRQGLAAADGWNNWTEIDR